MPPAKGLAKLRADMTKLYGDRITRRDAMTRPEAISTGSLTLDHATRVGGIPLKRTTEVLGPEGVGKTTLCTLAMINAQAMFPGRGVAYIDMEQTLDFEHAADFGLDLDEDRFLHAYPDHSEDVSDQIKMLLRDGDISLVVVDSIGGMESKAAFEKKAEDSAVGRGSQVISRMVKQVAGLCRANNAAVIFVNQFRADIGGPRPGAQKGAGPNALKYATTLKIEMRRTGETPMKAPIADSVSEAVKEIAVGHQLRARVTRNKLAAPGYAADFWVRHVATDQWGPIGVDRADEALVLGIATGAIRRINQSKYGLPDGTEINGRANVKTALLAEPALIEQVREIALAHVKGDVRLDHEVSFDDTEVDE